MPIDVLRGSKAKKVLEKRFDMVPSHGNQKIHCLCIPPYAPLCLGLGKAHSKEWWNALGKMMVQEGYLQENFQDIYKIYTLTEKGKRLLGSNPSQSDYDWLLTFL